MLLDEIADIMCLQCFVNQKKIWVSSFKQLKVYLNKFENYYSHHLLSFVANNIKKKSTGMVKEGIETVIADRIELIG